MASKQNGGSGRGFASMDPQKQREIASKGGASVPDAKRPFSQNRSLASEAGRKGGEARSRAHAASAAAKRALQPKENPQRAAEIAHIPPRPMDDDISDGEGKADRQAAIAGAEPLDTDDVTSGESSDRKIADDSNRAAGHRPQGGPQRH